MYRKLKRYCSLEWSISKKHGVWVFTWFHWIEHDWKHRGQVFDAHLGPFRLSWKLMNVNVHSKRFDACCMSLCEWIRLNQLSNRSFVVCGNIWWQFLQKFSKSIELWPLLRERTSDSIIRHGAKSIPYSFPVRWRALFTWLRTKISTISLERKDIFSWDKGCLDAEWSQEHDGNY